MRQLKREINEINLKINEQERRANSLNAESSSKIGFLKDQIAAKE